MKSKGYIHVISVVVMRGC